jgi:hypothetical protein
MPSTEVARLIFRNLTAVNEQLKVRVIPSQSMQTAVPKQVRARVAHVDNVKLAAHVAHDGQRRPHAVQVPILHSLVEQLGVEILHALPGAFPDVSGDRLVEPENPIGSGKNQFDESGNRHAARLLAASMAAHAVGDDHNVADFLRARSNLFGGQTCHHRLEVAPKTHDVEMIFVAGSDVARV